MSVANQRALSNGVLASCLDAGTTWGSTTSDKSKCRRDLQMGKAAENCCAVLILKYASVARRRQYLRHYVGAPAACWYQRVPDTVLESFGGTRCVHFTDLSVEFIDARSWSWAGFIPLPLDAGPSHQQAPETYSQTTYHKISDLY